MGLGYRELADELDTAPVASPRGLPTKELLGVCLEPEMDLYAAPGRSLLEGKQKDYLFAELAWYLNGSRKAADIAPASKFWLKIQDRKGEVNSNYGNLAIYEPPGLKWAVEELRRDPDSRRAIVLYNKPKYVCETKDFPCTQLQHFLLRGGKLHSIVYLRSSDYIRGLSFDVPWFRFLLLVVANSLHAEPGQLQVMIGSSHVYQEHFRLLKEMCGGIRWDNYRLSTEMTLESIMGHRNRWTPGMLERKIRVEEI